MMTMTRITLVFLLLVGRLSALTLPENYDSYTRPNQGGVADVVNVSAEILAISDVNEARSEMTIDISLQSSWVDSRLMGAVKKETLIVNHLPNIWIPDVQIANSANGYSKDRVSSQYLQINEDGLVRLSQKQTVKISCQISLAKYPFDRQLCKVRINSYGYSSVHLKLFWHGTVPDQVSTYHPEFSFSYAEQTADNFKTPQGAEYSNLYLEIAVTRCPLRVIFRAMLPSLMLLALSYYLSFCHCPILTRDKATANGNGNHVEATVIPAPQPLPTLNALPGFNLLLIAINGMILFLTVLIAQLNFVASPRSSALSGLDVWLSFVTAILFVILWHSVQLHFDNTYRTIHRINDNDSCYVNNINTIFKFGIPPLVIVFLIVFFGVYLS